MPAFAKGFDMHATGIPVLNAEQTAELLQKVDAKEVMRRVFTRLAAGQAIQPAQKVVLLPDGKGDFINYFGVDMSRNVLGVKISPYLVTPGKPIITAWTLLMSVEDGRPLMLCDASLLTTERTAATTALAVDLLAPANAGILTVIGTGPVGRAHIRHAMTLRKWKEIRVWGRHNLLSASEMSRELGLPEGLLSLSADITEATRDSDVVMLCTSSATPVLDPDTLSRPCLITSISTNAPGAHEVPPSSLNNMDVYCDYRHTTPVSAGEMVLATKDHQWSADHVLGDLPELVTGACQKPLSTRHVFFRSLGLGLEDIAIAETLLTHFKQQDI